MNAVIAFDTSAYTTSVALAAEHGLQGDYRQVLQVKPGQRGLRQSEAVFDHIRNLPGLMEKAGEQLTEFKIKAVGASVSPTTRSDSYMPVFVAGSSWGRSLASALQVPFYAFSHQEGHIRAGIIDSGINRQVPFLAIHFSGGTSELMRVQHQAPGKYLIEGLLAGSDLAAGQLVDRVGVKLGLPFPAGASMEQLAATVEISEGELPVLPSAIKPESFSFSGAEAEAMRQIERGTPAALIAQAVFRCIANTLEKIIRQASPEGPVQVLLAGGVMANQLIKNRLQQRLDEHRWTLCFAQPGLATDNAAGIALLTLEQHLQNEIY